MGLKKKKFFTRPKKRRTKKEEQKYWSYDPHRLRDSVSPVCGIFSSYSRILDHILSANISQCMHHHSCLLCRQPVLHRQLQLLHPVAPHLLFFCSSSSSLSIYYFVHIAGLQLTMQIFTQHRGQGYKQTASLLYTQVLPKSR